MLNKLHCYLLWLTLSIGAYLVQHFLNGAMIFKDSQFVQGYFWQLWTAHLSHIDWQHLLQNMLMLAVLIVFFSPSLLDTFKLFNLTAIACTLYFIVFDIAWYSGFSATLFAFASYWFLQQNNIKLKISLLGVLLLVLMIPYFGLAWSMQTVPVLHSAHWIGFCCGVGYYVYVQIKSKVG